MASADLLTLAGEVELAGGASEDAGDGDRQSAAERCFPSAIELAEKQSARLWELRARIALCRLRPSHENIDALAQLRPSFEDCPAIDDLLRVPLSRNTCA